MLKRMQDRCREMMSSRRRRQLSVMELLRHGRIVTDPEKLACLDAEVARRKGKAEGDRLRAKPEPAP